MQTIVDGGFGLIEGPVWDSRRNGLYISDITHGGVHFVDASTLVVERDVVPHRKGIGGLSLSGDGVVVSGRNVAWKPFSNPSQTVVLQPRDEGGGLLGFNDITTDANGRILAGGLAHRPDGTKNLAGGLPTEQLYLIDLDGSSKVIGGGISLSNGLGFSPDGSRLYHADTPTDSVWVYDVSNGGSTFGPRRVFAELESGAPDGPWRVGGRRRQGAPVTRSRPRSPCRTASVN